MSLRNNFLACIFSLVCASSWGQSIEQLMNEKKNLLEQISISSLQLETFKADIDDVTLKIKVQKKEINKLTNLIRAKRKVIKINKNIISSFNVLIDSLASAQIALQDNYAERVNRLYINALLNKNKVKPISANINHQTKNKVYADQYYHSCKSQADQINHTITQSNIARKDLKAVIEENIYKISKLEIDKKNLVTLVDKDKNVSKKLKSQRKSINKEIDKKNKKLKILSNTIKSLIKSSSTKKPTDILLSNKFEANRSIFPSPLSGGVIISEFGEQSHPINKNIKIFNNGVDILSNQSVSITSIFDGIIMSIQSVPGLNQVVIIKHGSFFTVYANLIRTSKKIGDPVKTGEIVGDISSSKQGKVLHFELWNNLDQMDPEEWINF